MPASYKGISFAVNLRLRAVFCLIIFMGGGGKALLSQTPSIPVARIVLFTPSDIDAPSPDSYLPRLHQFGEYAEQFFDRELKAWGYASRRKEIFDRGDDGKIQVIHVKGDLKAAGDEYKKEWLSRQVLGKLKNEHKIETAGNLFWIFVYLGDPPAKHSNYRGAGDSKNGGWAVLNYTNLPGEVSLDEDPVSDFHHQLFLKGCIHEFGHGLGLPHIGPKVELKKGNTLMGPVTRIYTAQKQPNPAKAYLSEASAAILSAHPIFTGDPSFRNKLPSTEWQEIKVVYDSDARGISVTGKLKANHQAHRIVVIDDRDDKPGAYWVKGYVSGLNDQSRFSVAIPRPHACSGNLKLLAVYENGAVTGGGLKRGIGSAKIIPYSFP